MRGRSTRERDFSENARTLHARAQFSARMPGRSTRERDFQREFLHRGPPTLHVGPPFFTDRRTILQFYFFFLLQPLPRSPTKMRGHSTRERDFRREYEDAPRESAILGENVRTLHARARFPARMRGRSGHARARFPARMRGRSTRERDFRRECEDALRESAISGENVRMLHARARFSARMRGRSTRERDFSENARTLRENAISARMRGRSTRERDFQRECHTPGLFFRISDRQP